MRLKKSANLILGATLALCLSVIGGDASRGATQETESTVPELVSFHDIIYPIWHTAYPQKDYAALRGFAPEVKKLAEKIYAAKLPGILRDKEAKWKQGLEDFKSAVDGYVAAASGTDDEALLNAAEDLHAKYEMMVRIIRPVLKEVDAFHKVLYIVYHKYLPNKDYESIKSVSEEMALKAEAITKASLPKRLESKSELFRQAASELYESAKMLVEIAKSGEEVNIETAVEKVHTRYQSLEKIFD
ncbi:MAG: hypothetical protein QHH14_03000 [Clostridiales bacterium]|nr:hypothetical protein [Clostridiales bacterium]